MLSSLLDKTCTNALSLGLALNQQYVASLSITTQSKCQNQIKDRQKPPCLRRFSRNLPTSSHLERCTDLFGKSKYERPGFRNACCLLAPFRRIRVAKPPMVLASGVPSSPLLSHAGSPARV